jgi:hypothetical protein
MRSMGRRIVESPADGIQGKMSALLGAFTAGGKCRSVEAKRAALTRRLNRH